MGLSIFNTIENSGNVISKLETKEMICRFGGTIRGLFRATVRITLNYKEFNTHSDKQDPYDVRMKKNCLILNTIDNYILQNSEKTTLCEVDDTEKDGGVETYLLYVRGNKLYAKDTIKLNPREVTKILIQDKDEKFNDKKIMIRCPSLEVNTVTRLMGEP